MNARLVMAALLVASLITGGSSCAQNKGKASDKAEKAGKGHGWLGVSIEDLTPHLAREREIHVKSGALVNEVFDESPADEAGIKEDDVIVEFNGKAIEESNDLLQAVRATPPGTQANVVLMRGTEKMTISVTLAREPHRHFAMGFHGPSAIHIPPIHLFTRESMMGLTMSDLNRQLGEYFQAPGGRGVLVQEVERSSTSDKAGFKAGDVIIKVNGESVETVGDITEALEGVKKGDKVAFDILRRGEQKTLSVEAEDPLGGRWFRFHPDNRDDDGAAIFGIRRDAMKRQMEHLKDDLRTMGDRIRSEVTHLCSSFRCVI